MIDNTAKQAALTRILSSTEFKHSKTNKKLLSYLVEASINNEELKEFTIGTDVFGKDSSFNCGEDPIVRVSIHNLRLKLEKYYQDEGKHDKVKITIPKGHYDVCFTGKPVINFRRHLKHINTYLYIVIFILLIFLVLTQIELNSRRKGIVDNDNLLVNNQIWGDLLHSNRPKLIVLGDLFFFVDSLNSLSGRTILRKETINSPNEFKAFIAASNKDSYSRLQYPLFAMNSIWPLPDILEVFTMLGIKYTLKYASVLNSTDLKTYDIVFIGSFPTLALLDRMMNNSKYDYVLKPQNKLIVNNDTTITYTRQGSPDGDHQDYSLVRKIPGPNQNIILAFLSFHATGITGAVNTFTRENSLEELEVICKQKFDEVPEYFDIIFKSTGYDRVVFSTDIVYLEKVVPSQIRW